MPLDMPGHTWTKTRRVAPHPGDQSLCQSRRVCVDHEVPQNAADRTQAKSGLQARRVCRWGGVMRPNFEQGCGVALQMRGCNSKCHVGGRCSCEEFCMETM